MAQPAVWNSGIGLTYASPGCRLSRPAKKRALLVRPRWCSSAPLGKPVVSEVYWIWAMSSGRTSGRAACTGAVARKSAQSVK